jgi:hypothetical protein
VCEGQREVFRSPVVDCSNGEVIETSRDGWRAF